MPTPADPALAQLLAAAARQTRSRFEQEVREGKRDPVAELAAYKRQRRHYASLLRMGEIPVEARELAERLLDNNKLKPDPEQRRAFDIAVAEMLLALYADFIATGESTQGSR